MTNNDTNGINLFEIIIKILAERHGASGGHCGAYGVELMQKTGKDWQEIRKALKPLFTDKKIEVRDGSKGNLSFLKTEKRKSKR